MKKSKNDIFQQSIFIIEFVSDFLLHLFFYLHLDLRSYYYIIIQFLVFDEQIFHDSLLLELQTADMLFNLNFFIQHFEESLLGLPPDLEVGVKTVQTKYADHLAYVFQKVELSSKADH